MKVAWALKQVPQEIAGPELIYDLYRRHRLVPDSLPLAVGSIKALADSGWVAQVLSGNTAVATVIVSNMVPGERCDLDFVPIGKFFRGRYERDLRRAMEPVWEMVFDEHSVRRVTACVPESRGRTVKALKALGFEVEGVMRHAVKIVDREPEGLVLMGLLAEDLED